MTRSVCIDTHNRCLFRFFHARALPKRVALQAE